MPEVESETPIGENGKFRDILWRCEAVWSAGWRNSPTQCSNDSSVTTKDGSHYCNIHDDWDWG